MGLEQRVNYQLNKYPTIKKAIKWMYQHLVYGISPKIKSEGNIIRVSPDDQEWEYFFGYYDKSPWDITDRYLLCVRAKDTWSDVSPKEKAEILLIDTAKFESDWERVKKIGETRAWNVQQSCMLQWLGPDYSSRILYNDFRDGKYCAVILSLETMEERVIPAAVYTVSGDGKLALTLDFSRLYNLRPGYGYYNVPERTKGIGLPDATALWRINLETGEVAELLSYKDFADFEPRPEMREAEAVHKINHLMLSPNGKRFMVLYRWFIGQRKYTRLMTCNVDGTGMYVLSDDDMVSHCFWKNNHAILAFANKSKTGPGYYLMKDETKRYVHCWKELNGDGHPSYSPDGRWIVTDSYPNGKRMQFLRIMRGEKYPPQILARVFAPFKYDNDTRCDLHPRWNHAGTKICFDGAFEGHRGLYTVSVGALTSEGKKCGRKQMDKLLFIARNDVLTDSSSVGKKVYGEYRAFSEFFDTFLISQSGNQIVQTHDGKSKVVKETKRRSQILKEINRYAAKVALEESCRYVYIRYPKTNPIFLSLLKRLKKQGCRIILEFPTFPYDQEIMTYGKTFRSRCIFYVDRLCRGSLKKYVYRAATFSKDKRIFGILAFQIYNGIFVNEIKPRAPRLEDAIHVIAVAEMQQSHGYDRMIVGMREYYQVSQERKMYFHLVGEGPEKAKYEKLVRESGLEQYVIFYGYCTGEKLEEIYDQSTLAVETLGLHRVGISLSSSLKSREYLSKGLPLISSVDVDVIPKDYPYLFPVAGDESPIPVKEVLSFYDQVYAEGPERVRDAIRGFAETYCHMSKTLLPVREKFYE